MYYIYVYLPEMRAYQRHVDGAATKHGFEHSTLL